MILTHSIIRRLNRARRKRQGLQAIRQRLRATMKPNSELRRRRAAQFSGERLARYLRNVEEMQK